MVKKMEGDMALALGWVLQTTVLLSVVLPG